MESSLTDWIEHLLALSKAHPHLLGLIVFASATAEAVIVVGALMPGTAIILTAAGMAGAANLPLWPLILWAAAGAAIGDGLSYWIGQHYGPALGRRRPLASRPQLMQLGTDFFGRHGGKSVFLARFVPGVKAIIPAIAGMAAMPLPRFLAASFASAVIWAALHVLPAAATGVLLANIGAVSGRLLGALVVAVIVLFLAFRAARLLVVRAAPRAMAGYRTAIRRLERSDNRLLGQAAQAIDPDNPKLLGAALWSGLLILATVGFALVVDAILTGDPLTRADVAMTRLIQSLRTPPADRVMLHVTAYGDGLVVGVTVGVLVLALAVMRQWRIALLIGLAFAFAGLTLPLIDLGLERQPPSELEAGYFDFPSGHTALATLLLATLALLIAANLGRRRQIAVWMAATLGVIAIGLSRVYLGVHWPSGALGGILYGGLVGSLLALLLHFKADLGRAAAWSAAAATIVLIGYGSLHARLEMSRDLARYAPAAEPTLIDARTWRQSAWADLPRQRIDLLGETEEPLTLQYQGPVDTLADHLKAAGWQEAPPSRPAQYLKLLSAATELAALPPWPLLHDGLPPRLMLTKPDEAADRRLVFRLWPSMHSIQSPAGNQPIMLASLTEETVEHPYNALTIMRDDPAPPTAMADIASHLENDPAITITRRIRSQDGSVYLAEAGSGA